MINSQKIKQKIMEKKILEAAEDTALVTQISKIMADSMLFYFKAHSFHWNVEGSNFNDYHAFFAGVYEAAFAKVDPLAEFIRQLGSYAPSSLSQLINTANLTELNSKPVDAMAMFRILKADNENIMVGLSAGRRAADASGYTDIANFLDDMLGAQRKLSWMLDSLLK